MKTQLTEMAKFNYREKVAMLLFMFVFFQLGDAAAQNDMINTSQLGAQITQIAQPVYKIISMIVAGAGLVMMGKSLVEGIKGEPNAWMKFGTVFVVCAIWFFVVPGITEWLFARAGVSGVHISIS